MMQSCNTVQYAIVRGHQNDSTGNDEDANAHEPNVIITDRESGLMSVINELNPLAHKFVRVWTSEVLHFGVEATNRVESEHSILKLWISTCHGDLDTVLLNIGFVIEGQIAEIKKMEYSRLKEKYNVSNPILKNISNNISHRALKKI
ncbi:hypothetical protein M9H77_02372 [Catharanthus roseus]|uniref:Uncharacterized protein n=1 Tax=Catharanthus roseus TaxID=4058 RepID=A0ACC0C8D3_CATRO|nr:hypothetical protein M9H77_02372 [Catharanthus roseus]